MFVSFNMAIITGIYIVAVDHWFAKEINPYAIQVFFGFLALSGGTSVLTVYDKFKNRQGEDCGTKDNTNDIPNER